MESEPRKLRRLPLIVVGVTAIAVVADRITKMWALDKLIEGENTPLLGNWLSFELIHNPGAAFSLGQGSTWIFTILSVLVLGAIIWYTLTGKITSKTVAVLTGFVAAGATGNLIDRLIQPPSFGQGHVIDFINYNDWFVGNVADIWIVGGAVALMGYFLFQDSRNSKIHNEQDIEGPNE